MKPLYVNGVGLWTPGYPSPTAWVRGEHDPAATVPPRFGPTSRIGRYTSLVTRIALHVLEQAARSGGADLGDVATVFGSANGEIRTAFEQFDMIEADGTPSPLRFKNSVHNTASGHFSIATGCTGFTTALTAGRNTFAMSLLEAWAWLETHAGDVVVVVADEPLPDPIAAPRFDPLGIALHLSVTAPAAAGLGRIRGLVRRDLDPAAIELPRNLADNPCAAGIPLVERLVRGRSGVVPLAPIDEGWSVAYDARS